MYGTFPPNVWVPIRAPSNHIRVNLPCFLEAFHQFPMKWVPGSSDLCRDNTGPLTFFGNLGDCFHRLICNCM